MRPGGAKSTRDGRTGEEELAHGSGQTSHARRGFGRPFMAGLAKQAPSNGAEEAHGCFLFFSRVRPGLFG